MSAFSIKIIAILTMVIDHIGYFIFPDMFFLRAIGRLSFPLFGWLVANGAKHTKNLNKYLKRLFIFGLVSQIPFLIANRQIKENYLGLNIMFTLFLGLLSIKIIKSKINPVFKILIISSYTAIAPFINVSYGFVGILSILCFYVFFENPRFQIISQALLYTVLWPFQVIIKGETTTPFTILQSLAVLSLYIIFRYSGQEGPKIKHLFYWFYPIHYIIFYLILTYAK